MLLCWNLRHGVAVVPKVSSLEHAAECFAAAGRAAALTPAHMQALDAIAQEAPPVRFVDQSFMRPSTGQRAAYMW